MNYNNIIYENVPSKGSISYQHLKDVKDFLYNHYFKYTIDHSFDISYDDPNDTWHTGRIINLKLLSIDYNIIKQKLSHIPEIHQNKIYQIFEEQGFNDLQNWTATIIDDFYGEFIDEIILNSSILDNIITNLNLYYDINFYNPNEDSY